MVDDKDQDVVIDSIKLQLRNEFDLDFISIRTSASELKKEDAEDIDLDKLKSKIKSEIQNKNIYIALTDFDLECDYLNGLNIVKIVHEFRSRVKFIIYSGNWDKVIRTVVGKEHHLASTDELVKGINELINSNIINCIARTDYKEDLIKYLRRYKGDSIEHRLSTLLRSNGDMKFESCFPDFKGLTFNEIADLIDNQSDARTDEWLEEVLTQTIAYLVTVNK